MRVSSLNSVVKVIFVAAQTALKHKKTRFAPFSLELSVRLKKFGYVRAANLNPIARM